MGIHLHMNVQLQMPVLTGVTSGVPQAVFLDQAQLFPIREVARLTGINPVTLRAWERRYGLIVPTRTESGHRLYSMTDIERVRSILGWIDRGVAVSKIGTLLARAVPPANAVPHHSQRPRAGRLRSMATADPGCRQRV